MLAESVGNEQHALGAVGEPGAPEEDPVVRRVHGKAGGDPAQNTQASKNGEHEPLNALPQTGDMADLSRGEPVQLSWNAEQVTGFAAAPAT